jgi:hypothetical protein
MESESSEEIVAGPSKKVLRRRNNVCYKDLTDSVDSDLEDGQPPPPPAFTIYKDLSTGGSTINKKHF